jgi:hypothetical protein
LSVAGLVVFGGYTIVDFNRLRRAGAESAVPIAASIFLGMINVFVLLTSCSVASVIRHPERRLHMRSLGGATEWLNSEPLTSAWLPGHVVLMSFWTLTCIPRQPAGRHRSPYA